MYSILYKGKVPVPRDAPLFRSGLRRAWQFVNRDLLRESRATAWIVNGVRSFRNLGPGLPHQSRPVSLRRKVPSVISRHGDTGPLLKSRSISLGVRGRPRTSVAGYLSMRKVYTYLRVPNTMKYTLRCHDFGLTSVASIRASVLMTSCRVRGSQNRAGPQGVAATIAASFVARLANTASIGCTSLRASDDSDSQRTRISLC